MAKFNNKTGVASVVSIFLGGAGILAGLNQGGNSSLGWGLGISGVVLVILGFGCCYLSLPSNNTQQTNPSRPLMVFNSGPNYAVPPESNVDEEYNGCGYI